MKLSSLCWQLKVWNCPFGKSMHMVLAAEALFTAILCINKYQVTERKGVFTLIDLSLVNKHIYAAVKFYVSMMLSSRFK